MTAGLLVRGIGLVGTLILTRFVAPAALGDFSIAYICVASGIALTSMIPGSYVIAHATDARETRELMVGHLSMVGIATLLVVAGRDALAAAVHAPGVAQFIPGLAVAAMTTQLSVIPSALLARDLRFGMLSVSRVAGELAFTVTSVALAPTLGVTAMVVGNLTRAALVSVLILPRVPSTTWLPRELPRRRTLLALVRFGLPLSLSSLATFFATQWDNLLVARLLGSAAAGRYNVAYKIVTAPLSHIGEQLSDVLLPAFSAVPDRARKQHAFTRALGTIALVVCPLAAAIGVLAQSYVPLFLDRRWADLAPMLAILSVVGVSRPIVSAIAPLLQAQGKPRVVLVISLLSAFLVLVLLAAFGGRGEMWACGVVSGAFATSCLACVVIAARAVQIPLRSIIHALLPGLFVTVALTLSVLAARAALFRVLPEASLTRLALEIGAAATGCCLAGILAARRQVSELFGTVFAAARKRNVA